MITTEMGEGGELMAQLKGVVHVLQGVVTKFSVHGARARNTSSIKVPAASTAATGIASRSTPTSI